MRIAVVFALTAVGAFGLYNPDGLYSYLSSSAAPMPETVRGLRPGASLAFVNNLSEDKTSAYFTFQLYDLFYQLAAMTLLTLVIARAIRALPAYAERLERLLIIPFAMIAFELIENLSLSLMASGISPGSWEYGQQAMTTLKLWLTFLLFPLSLTAFVVAAVDGVREAVGAKKG